MSETTELTRKITARLETPVVKISISQQNVVAGTATMTAVFTI